MSSYRLPLFLTTGLLFCRCLSAQEALMDASFDGVANGTAESFSFLGNSIAVAAGGNWSGTDGHLSMTQDVASAGTMGIVSDVSIDGRTLEELRIVWVVEGITDPDAGPTNNGFFLGITGQDGEWWNNSETASAAVDQWSVGFRIGGGANTATLRSLQLSYDAAPVNRGVFSSLGTASLASLQDGFKVSLTFNTSGWSIDIVGLVDSAGTALTGGTGSWNGDIDFSTITADSNVFVASFYQQESEAGTLVDFASVTVDSGSFDPDTDNDGLRDAWEELYFEDLDEVGTGDPDNDGLDNEFEENAGTAPNDNDTDDDNLEDGDELNGTLNPWSNGVKSAPPGDSSNPLVPDSDGDGVEDGAEILAGTDPNAAPPNTGPKAPFIDSDGDGYRDEAEMAFGSAPDNPDDIPDHRPSSGTVKPNIVIIYADDLGLGDVSAYGDLFGTSSPAVTPHMDSLAAEGVLFTQGHSCNGVCTPSRYGLLTGIYNWREFNGITGNWGGRIGGDELPRVDDVTIAEFLKTQGYDTAALGKWHLGGAFYRTNGTRITDNPSNPAEVDWERRVDLHAVDHGFDFFRGNACAINFVPYVYLVDDRMQYWDPALNAGDGAFRDALNTDPFRWWSRAQVNATVLGRKGSRDGLGDPSYNQVDVGPRLVADVESYFAERAASEDTDPFFTYIALNSPHYPWALTEPFIGDDSAAGFYYADWMREVDTRVGRILTAIEDNGFGENTIVVFTSDNGPENGAMSDSLSRGKDPNGPLRGNKRDTWDGGTRVPFMVRWPGQAAAGLQIDDPVWQGDIFATIAAYLGEELPDSTAPDGESFLNLLRGQEKPGPKRQAITMSSIRGDLGLKTVDGWKLIDGTGGGDGTSWDASNVSIPSAAGANRGSPKQLFHQAVDLGEDLNLIATQTSDAAIRAEIEAMAGRDLLGLLDDLRENPSTVLFKRSPDNDGDGIPNAYELSNGLDPDWPKDGNGDLDGDEASNIAEFIAGTDPGDRSDFLAITDLVRKGDTLTVTWPGVADRVYEVFWSIDALNWTSISSLIGSGGILSDDLDLNVIDAVDGVEGNLGRLFVRVGVDFAAAD